MDNPRALQPTSPFLAAARELVAAKRSRHTRTAYTADLERWLGFCSLAGVDPALATLGHATRFRDGLLERLAPASVLRALTALSAIYRKLLPARIVAANPFHAAVLGRPVVPRIGRTEAVDDDAARRMILLASQESPRDAALLRLLYDTGLRRMSVARLRRDEIRRVQGRLVLRVPLKGGLEGEVFLPPACARTLEAWILVAPSSEHVFPGRDGGPIDESVVNHVVGRWAKAAGAEGVHPHRFRAAFVTSAYDAGIPEREIQASVHHSDPDTTRRYDRGSRGSEVAEKVALERERKGR